MKVVVTIPTFNERANLELLLAGLFQLPIPGLEVWVVDDDSPDGTGPAVDDLKGRYPGLRLIRRDPPRGRGLAGREGFVRALESGFDYLVEMDGDGSHQPRYLPALLSAMRECDIALGSRTAPGGTDPDRPWLRRVLTRASNRFARWWLGVPVSDVNSGFRCFSRQALEKIHPETLTSEGPAIVHEVLWRAARAGLRMKEVPIEFIDRHRGTSKLNVRGLVAGYVSIVRLGAR